MKITFPTIILYFLGIECYKLTQLIHIYSTFVRLHVGSILNVLNY